MLSNLSLLRPIIFFDTETTGTDTAKDRIIELSVNKFFPDGTNEIKTIRVNPGIPIPPAATAIHGISDEDVKDAPPFSRYAKGISAFFEGSDLGGYNSIRYDIPLLAEEFLRAGAPVPFDENTKYVDAMRIYHQMEKRDLTAAYKFYCGKDHQGAHGAEADTLVTVEVFKAQIEKYNLDPSIDSLHKISTECKTSIDFGGKFIRNKQGDIVFNFGMHIGKLASSEPRYLSEFMLSGDFPLHTKHCINKILAGELK